MANIVCAFTSKHEGTITWKAKNLNAKFRSGIKGQYDPISEGSYTAWKLSMGDNPYYYNKKSFQDSKGVGWFLVLHNEEVRGRGIGIHPDGYDGTSKHPKGTAGCIGIYTNIAKQNTNPSKPQKGVQASDVFRAMIAEIEAPLANACKAMVEVAHYKYPGDCSNWYNAIKSHLSIAGSITVEVKRPPKK